MKYLMFLNGYEDEFIGWNYQAVVETDNDLDKEFWKLKTDKEIFEFCQNFYHKHLKQIVSASPLEYKTKYLRILSFQKLK